MNVDCLQLSFGSLRCSRGKKNTLFNDLQCFFCFVFLLSNVLTLKRLERLKVLLFQTAIHCLVMIYVKRTQRTFYIYTYCTKILLK